ncbi:FeoA family protein [Pseudodesulfovibrio senegalensis]|uniref:Ferrous iron transport protein A n=1 Tax=Pseudodesulfovibrio senegalensis TaxID=1721087 RepID=A0A6N6MWW4_9BACT|nr:FeoA family protein [Pseudodesulfovibrio senegalensis]KAB1437264.1 ferrous iron transport protein A [Pseudodesulfovibrio senegalensis]
MEIGRTLSSLTAGDSAMVVAIDAGRRAQTRLESLGLVPGVFVEIINNGRGPMLVCVGEGRVIVERGIAGKVLVA